MKHETVLALTGTFESHAQETENGVEFWLARDLQHLLGYEKWRNFDNLVKRAQNLIATGEAVGKIVERAKEVGIGSGATRSIRDYELDEDAVNLLARLSAGYKLNSHYPLRNETTLLRLADKYWRTRGIEFEFQAKRMGIVFDGIVAKQIAIEFDEPHHEQSRRQSDRDTEKDRVAGSLGLVLVRFTLAHDVVDIILKVEALLSSLEVDAADRVSIDLVDARDGSTTKDTCHKSEESLFDNFLRKLCGEQAMRRVRVNGDRVFFGELSSEETHRSLSVPANRPLADFAPNIILKAKDFATEITIHNSKEHQLSTERAISDEHISNNEAVRKTLLQRGIRPEKLPAAEDVKKVERRLAAEEKRSLGNPDAIATQRGDEEEAAY